MTKLVDDDSELTDKYGETNTNPYVDNTNNNEDENLNTKSVERGSKLYYQVWLDTTKFDAANKDNIQTVGITDNYDKDKLNVNASDIKVYDSVTGADVTRLNSISLITTVFLQLTLKLASLSHLATLKILKSLIQLSSNLDATINLISQQQ